MSNGPYLYIKFHILKQFTKFEMGGAGGGGVI